MANHNIRRPESNEYAPYYAGYVSLVPEVNILEVLRQQSEEMGELIGSIPEERAGFRYDSGKWSIREVIGHLTDAERVFSFRALAFARGDSLELPSFDENGYVEQAVFDRIPLLQLGDEFKALRSANVLLFEHLSNEAWTRFGIVNGNLVTVRALAYIIAGHVRHHHRILRERYLLYP
jgi:DinB superfamily